jgi:hypothetical protein
MIHFYVLNLIPNPAKVNPVRKFRRGIRHIEVIPKFNPSTERQGITGKPRIEGLVFTLLSISQKNACRFRQAIVPRFRKDKF